MLEYFFFTIPFIIIFTNILFKKYNFLCSLTGNNHQKFANPENIPLTGGVFLFLLILILFFKELYQYHLFIFSIFIIGILSDLNTIKSPNYRFIIQLIFVLVCTILNNIQIQNTGVDLLDLILSNSFINYLFVTFCILIIINGSNFLDGLNTLVVGYYLIVTIILFKLQLFNVIGLEHSKLIFFIFLLSMIFFLNFFNQMFLGDNGSYFLGFLFSILLINIYYKYQYISSFFIILMLWYPAFENLFSIIRKISTKRSPLIPDQNHFHQLLFHYLYKKFEYKKKYLNSISAFIINFYNLLIFFAASHYIFASQIQIIFIIFNILVYSTIYYRLFNFKYGKLIN